MTRWQKILTTVAMVAPSLVILLGPRSPYAASWEMMLGGFAIAIMVAGYASWRVAMEQVDADLAN